MQDCHEGKVRTALNGQVTNLHNGTILSLKILSLKILSLKILSLKILSLKYLVDNDVFSL